MTNLLPPEKKEALRTDARKRLVIVLGISAIVPLLCLIFVLASIHFYMLGEVDAEQAVLEQAKKKYQTPDFLMLRDTIEKNNTVLGQLAAFYKKEVYVTDVLHILLGISRPEHIFFTSISMDRTKDENIKATVSGVSRSRDDLLMFQKNIQENDKVKNLSFSPESWISATDVKFYFTFEIQHQ